MTFIDEGDSMEEAEWLIVQRYSGRLDPEGAHRVEIANKNGMILRSNPVRRKR
jgi:hypothetical protein